LKAILIIFIILLVLVSAEFFLIAPRMKKKRPIHSRKRYYAHRGLFNNKKVPENSLLAFELAVKGGYGIELDVHLTADGVPVVFHDADTRRVCGVSGEIEKMTYGEISSLRLLGTEEKIPTLEEALKVIDGRVPLIIELKSESAKQVAVCEVADEVLGNYKGEYCIESFNPFCVAWYKKHRPDILRGVLCSNFMKDPSEKSTVILFVLQTFWLNVIARPDFIAFNHKYRSYFLYRICKKIFDPLCAAWTVRSSSELEPIKEEFDMFIFEGFFPE